MPRTLLLASVLLTLGFASGCVVHARGGATAHVSSPDLVYVSPGVYVIADYHEPVFYSNGYYWLYRDGYWLRSGYYSGGWVRVHTVPGTIRRIHRPRTYVRYRASGTVYRRDRSGRVIQHRGGRNVRDHRAPPPRRGQRAAPNRGNVRDHRAPPPRDRRDRRDRDRKKRY